MVRCARAVGAAECFGQAHIPLHELLHASFVLLD